MKDTSTEAKYFPRNFSTVTMNCTETLLVAPMKVSEYPKRFSLIVPLLPLAEKFNLQKYQALAFRATVLIVVVRAN
jgi:hypothetical protein